MQGFIWCLKTERAFVNDRFRTMTSGGLASLVTWHLKNQHVAYLDRFQAELQLGAASAYKVRDEIETLDAKSMTEGALVAVATPSLNGTRQALNRTRATLRCLRVLNALQRDIERAGANDVQLADLGLSNETTTDPFSGKSLIVDHSEQGWTVYSVGTNLKDDGGSLTRHDDTGAGVGRQPAL